MAPPPIANHLISSDHSVHQHGLKILLSLSRDSRNPAFFPLIPTLERILREDPDDTCRWRAEWLLRSIRMAHR